MHGVLMNQAHVHLFGLSGRRSWPGQSMKALPPGLSRRYRNRLEGRSGNFVGEGPLSYRNRGLIGIGTDRNSGTE